MDELILFIMTFVVVFLLYQLLIKIKNSKKQDLLEVKYLSTIYNLDINKIDKKQLLLICSIVSSLDISIAVSLVSLLDGFILEIVGGLLIISFLIFVTYYLIYLFYKKKGMVINGKHNKNGK